MTLLAKDLFLSVARPRSPILTDPVVPVMKILSHLRSLQIYSFVYHPVNLHFSLRDMEEGVLFLRITLFPELFPSPFTMNNPIYSIDTERAV